LQVLEERDAQVSEDAFAHPAGEVGLHVAHRPVEQAGEEERADDPPELSEVVLADAVVECVLREERRRECRGGCHEQ
jgi:hypothetical protein